MRYMLLMFMDPTIWEALSEAERTEVYRGHDAFQRTTEASGELVRTQALGEPSSGLTVRVAAGSRTVSDGLSAPADAFFCGYYLVECASQERAIELAALIPDARYTPVEVRPIVHEAGPGA